MAYVTSFAVPCCVVRCVLCRAVLPRSFLALVKFVPKDQMENRRVVSEAETAATAATSTAAAAQGPHEAILCSRIWQTMMAPDWLCPVTCAELCFLLLSAAVLRQVVCCNLKPAKMRDIMSYAMVKGGL